MTPFKKENSQPILIPEFALTYDVLKFILSNNSNSCLSCKRFLLELLRLIYKESNIRNLKSGKWIKNFDKNPENSIFLSKLKKITLFDELSSSHIYFHDQKKQIKKKRTPKNDIEWCQEALKSIDEYPLTGVITTRSTYKKIDQKYLSNNYKDYLFCIDDADDVIQIMNKFHNQSFIIKRSKDTFENILWNILRCSRKVSIIDPYLTPSRQPSSGNQDYKYFFPLLNKLFENAHLKNRPEKLEIHVSGYYSGERSSESDPLIEKWTMIEMFSKVFGSKAFKKTNIEIHTWKGLHDRYILTNKVGFLFGNGFDTPSEDKYKHTTTMAKLSYNIVQEIERNLRESLNNHKYKIVSKEPKNEDEEHVQFV